MLSASRMTKGYRGTVCCLIIETRDGISWRRFLGEGDAAAYVPLRLRCYLNWPMAPPPFSDPPLRYLPMCRLTLTPAFFHFAANHRPSKMNRNSALAIALLILALSTVYAEIVHWTQCPSPACEYFIFFTRARLLRNWLITESETRERERERTSDNRVHKCKK